LLLEKFLEGNHLFVQLSLRHSRHFIKQILVANVGITTQRKIKNRQTEGLINEGIPVVKAG